MMQFLPQIKAKTLLGGWLLLSLCWSAAIGAQSEEDARFPEGIYFSHSSLLAGTPELRWSDIEGEMIQLPEDFRLQVDEMKRKDGGSLADIYAVSLDDFAYLFVGENTKLDYHEFAGLRLRGRYRYYEFQTTEQTANRMYAYNPLNGQPFRSAVVKREKLVLRQQVMDLASGRTFPFDRDGVADIVASDNDLVRAVLAISPEDADLDNKLRQALRVYNDRYPFLPVLPKPE